MASLPCRCSNTARPNYWWSDSAHAYNIVSGVDNRHAACQSANQLLRAALSLVRRRTDMWPWLCRIEFDLIVCFRIPCDAELRELATANACNLENALSPGPVKVGGTINECATKSTYIQSRPTTDLFPIQQLITEWHLLLTRVWTIAGSLVVTPTALRCPTSDRHCVISWHACLFSPCFTMLVYIIDKVSWVCFSIYGLQSRTPTSSCTC